jgi:ABC-type branched-subunit amino acid transport system substrate-binding protein
MEQTGIPYLPLFGDPSAALFPGKWVFKVLPTTDSYPKAVMDFISKTLHLKKIGLLYEANQGGTLWNEVMRTKGSEYGTQLVASEGVGATVVDATPQLRKLLAAGAEVIVSHLTGSPAVPLLNWAALGYPVPLVGGLALSSPNIIKPVGDDIGRKIAGIVAPYTSDSPLPRQQYFTSKFQQLNGKPAQALTAPAWDAVQMIAKAIGSGTVSRDALRTGLERKINKYDGAAGIYSYSTTSHQGYDPSGLEIIVYTGNGTYAIHKEWAKQHLP